MIDKGIEDKNVPLSDIESVLEEQDTRIYLGTGYLTKEQITKFAESKGTKGITLYDIQQSTRSKKNAQRKLKYFRESGILFTARDLIEQGIELPPNFRNRRPQRYYPTSQKASIIEKIKNDYKSVLLSTTGISQNNTPLFQSLEYQKASSFLDVLKLLPFSTVYVHKINLLFTIGKDNYNEAIQYGHDLGRKTERLGNYYSEYKYHANGSVQIFVESSKRPFRLENEPSLQKSDKLGIGQFIMFLT